MENISILLRRLKYHIINFTMDREHYNTFDEYYGLFTWKNPRASFALFLTMNYVLWSLIEAEIPFLGALFLISLHFILTGKIMSLIRIESPHSDEYPKCLDKISRTLSNIARFRKECHLEFCFMASMLFLILAYVSSIIPGSVICFILLWSAYLIPLIYKNLPADYKTKLEGLLESLEKFHEVIEEDDLIPLETEYAPDDNEDLESLGTDRTADSVTNSLISGISSMPSFLDAEDNREISEEDLIPSNLKQHELTPSFISDSSDSELEIKDVRLKDSHFSRDSSTDDEGKFEDGLHFEEGHNETLQESKGLVHNIVDYVISNRGFQLSNIMNNAGSSMQSTETKNTSSTNSSSDDDFEIIDLEELKK